MPSGRAITAVATALVLAAGAAVAFDGADPVLWVDRDSIGGACSDERSAEEASSESSPWCGIGRALEAAPSGSTVLVRGGSYPEVAAGFDGGRTSLVSFRAFEAAQVDVDG